MSVPFIVERQAVGDGCTLVAADVVVVYVAGSACCRVVQFVGIATLVNLACSKRVLNCKPLCRGVYESYPSGCTLLVVALLSGVSVCKESSPVQIVCTNRKGCLFACFHINGAFGSVCLPTAVACREPCTLVNHRGEGIDVYYASGGVASVECTLRAAEHLNAHNVPQICIKPVFVEVWHVIYIHSHGRVVYPAAQASHINGRGHL